jgi:hypothetical protein
MLNHKRSLVWFSACVALLAAACGQSGENQRTNSSTGGASSQSATVASGGQTAQGGAGRNAGSPAGGNSGIGGSSSGSGGNSSGGNASTGGRSSSGTSSAFSSGGTVTGGNTASAGGETSRGGSGGLGTSVTGGNASGGGGPRGGSLGSGGRGGTGGTGAGGSTSTGGAQSGGTGGSTVSKEGFYKELFVDVGVGLDHLPGVPAADGLGWEWELVSTDDTDVQHSYMWGNANDDNGVLLYPDREPRFMVMYTGGGYGDHAGPVGATGIKNVQDFFNNGGSYVGSCNGNYMAWDWAYKLWPGQIQMDGYEGQVEGIIPDNSPLLRYFNFGGDHLISAQDPDLDGDIGLMHYQGGFETGTLPEGTEVLLIGKSHTTKIDGDGHTTGYAYKPKASSGRVCGMNDHPEYALQNGEVMNYLQASLQYARDGVGSPDVKAALVNGEERVMDKSSKDNDPAHTKIGDKQYHHFTVSLPNGAKDLTVTLNADAGYDMNVYLAKDTFAFASRAKQSDTSKGPTKTLAASSLESGTWYIGVECATTVTATKTSHGYDYSGNLAVLNGVKYSIKASWTTP